MGKFDTQGTDLVVSFDTTGSMYPVLAQVRSQVKTFIEGMFKDIPKLRVSVIAHGDYCDRDNPYTIRALDFTTDLNSICEFVSETKKTYGGDADECYELVLNTARMELSWREESNKAMVLIGDANPHGVDYRDNVQLLDWKLEALKLNTMGVKIFAVHALANYRKSSANFYTTIAAATGGTYLTLDQFEDVMDVIKASCMSVYSEEKLNEFVSIIKENGRMNNSMTRNFARLMGIDVGYKAGPVQKDGMLSVLAGRFQVMTVNENCAIKEFVENNGIMFKRGRGFYELTKHETVQQYKEVIIQDRVTGEMFTGTQVRERLGLLPQIESGGAKENLSSRNTAEFRVFVQSTSFNRKLIAGTTFMYEITDLEEEETKKPKKSTKSKKEVKAPLKKNVVETPVVETPVVETPVVEEKAPEVKAPKKTKKSNKKGSKKADTLEKTAATAETAETATAEPEWTKSKDYKVASTVEEAVEALEGFSKVTEPAIHAELVTYKTPVRAVKEKKPKITAEEADLLMLSLVSETVVLASKLIEAKEKGCIDDSSETVKNTVESLRSQLKKILTLTK